MFAWNAFILTKQTIASRSLTQKFRKVNFPFHDRVCDARIRHLNHLRVIDCAVNKSIQFSQERRCHGSVKMIVNEQWVWCMLEWLTRPLQTMCLELTISRLMIRLRQTVMSNEKFCWYCLICYVHMNLNNTICDDFFSLCKNIEHQTLVSFL